MLRPPQQFHSSIWRDVATLEAELDETQKRIMPMRICVFALAFLSALWVTLTVFSGEWACFFPSIGFCGAFLWYCRACQPDFDLLRMYQDSIAAARALDPDRSPQPTSQRW